MLASVKPIATTYPRVGFMVRSEGGRIWRDFKGLQPRTTRFGAFQAQKHLLAQLL